MTLLLLDTHIWWWSQEGDVRRIGRRTRRLLATGQSGEAIRVSVLSFFELTALQLTGRLRLAHSAEQWMQRALTAPGVRVSELAARSAIDAGGIPRDALPDPIDRLLVATARQLDATFLTCDRRILDYAARTRNVRVHDGAT